MYLSTWLPASSLPGTWPTFWNGRTTAITGLVVVDGTTYTWCGAPSENFTLATQTALVVTATQSTYTLTAGPVTLTASFFSPVDPASLQRQSVPMSYITVTAAANDGGSHAVSIYLDISAEWAHGDDTQEVSWGQQTAGSLNVLTVTPSSPSVLAEYNDQASWGTVVWATDNVTGLTWQTGQDVVVRGKAAGGALPDTNDTSQPRAINDDWPVFGLMRDLGTITATPSAEVVVCIGHVRQPAVSYLGTNLSPYWTTYWSSWQDMLTWFRGDLPAALQTCSATDTAVNEWAGEQLGSGSAVAQQYAAITSLALRQAFGGTELVASPAGAPWAFLKEISSDGNVSTLDVLFPAFPAYLFSSGWSSAGAFAVGRGLFSGPTDWFAGSIDQVRVWSRALSDTDVSALVWRGLPRSRGIPGSWSGPDAHHAQVVNLAGELLASLGGDALVGDDRVRGRERAEDVQPDGSPLRVVGEHDQPAGVRDEGPVGLRLGDVRGREAGHGVHAVHAEKQDVDVHRPDGGVRRRADQGVGRRPVVAARQDDMRPAVPGALQLAPHLHRVGEHRDAPDLGELPGEHAGGGARRQADRGAGLDHRGGLPGDRRLLRLLAEHLLVEAGLLHAALGEHRAAVHPLQQPLALEARQVAPDGHLRDRELVSEARDERGAVALQLVQDALPPEHCKHDVRPVRGVRLC